ncbi:MAG: MotA/TolQ/ExbB proton channel family protein [Planctomyces sp.]|nr:MotA/TolQ/ExbB proton channel family protein [Planctomyces sp.]
MMPGVSSRSIQANWPGLAAGLLLLVSILLWPAGTAIAYQEGDGAAEAPAAAPAGDASAAPIEEESFLLWLHKASWPAGHVILLLSFWLVYVVVMLLLQLRRDGYVPQDFITLFEQKLTAKDFQGAYELAKSDDSYLARQLTAGLARLNKGYDEAVEGMQEVSDVETMETEHRLGYIALIASIAPMLGLLGTVQGMVMSFDEIAQSNTQPKPKDLAGGISLALVTTMEGLIIAIPAMAAYNLLRNRFAKLIFEANNVAAGLMSRFSTVGKTKPATPAPPTA